MAAETPGRPAGVTRSFEVSPLAFERIAPQGEAPGAFIAHTRTGNIEVRPAGITLALRTNGAAANAAPQTIGMKLTGAKSRAIEPVETLPGKANYFIGKDPSKWRTNVPLYGRLKQTGVYKGVDLVYYGNEKHLEFDFVVAPAADPKQIVMMFDGADKLDLDAEGNLVGTAAGGQLFQHKPLVYQSVDGVRRAVSGQFKLKDKGQVGFEIAAYDHSKPLTIDPVLSFSTYFGGSSSDFARAVAVDSAGYVYVAGGTFSADFPTANALHTTKLNAGGALAFVSKFDSSGALQYSTFIGGDDPGSTTASGIALDASDEVYITGTTTQNGFPHTAGAFQTFLQGDHDAFVTKLTANGTALGYSTYLGSADFDTGLGIAVDNGGSACVVGLTVSTGFPTKNPWQASFAGPSDAQSSGFGDYFVTKINATGSALIYSTYLGGAGKEGQSAQLGFGAAYSGAIALDADGNAYVVGTTASTDFPTTNAFQATVNKNSDCVGCPSAFLTKIGPAGELKYSTYLGGSEDDYGHGVAVNDAGEAYVTGRAGSCDFPLFRQAVDPNGPREGTFVTKFSADGSHLLYSTFVGQGSASAIAVDSTGHAYVTGQIAPGDFLTVCAVQPNHAPNNGASPTSNLDAFVAKLAPDGASFDYATYLGGSDEDGGAAIAVDLAGNAYVAGYTVSQDFPTNNPYQAANAGGVGAFVAFLANSSCTDSHPTFGPFTSWPPCSLAPPTITCPGNIVTSTAPGQCSAIVNYTVTATAHVGAPTVVSTPASGSAFPKGTTTVNCTVTDGIGRQATCSFQVTVNDTEKPVITCPGNIATPCSTAPLVPVSFTATATDNCDSSPAVSYSIASGSGFPIGSTTVTSTATDSSGNQATCSFTVTRAALGFTGFLSPIGGADATGGSFGQPVATFKAKSTIPVKFTASCGGSAVLTGIHRLQVIKYTDQTTAGDPIDATPTDAATTGDEFRLSDTQWHFNLDTKATGMTTGIWLLQATLSDGSQHSAWIQIK